MEKSTRERAMQWWNNLPTIGNAAMIGKHTITKAFYPDRFYCFLTGREIEHMWNNIKSRK